MFLNKKVLAIIPARSGSKGIPNKNIIDLCGKPLIYWTINAASKSKFIDDVAISSNSKKIISIAEGLGTSISIERPESISTDEASSIDVVSHALNLYDNYEWVVLLQPTSPLRNENHIDQCFSLLNKSGAQSAVSVCESKSKPNQFFYTNEDKKIKPLLGWDNLYLPRQKLTKYYELNGAIYIFKSKVFIKEKKLINEDTFQYIMDHNVSVDIDTLNDLNVAKNFLKKEYIK